MQTRHVQTTGTLPQAYDGMGKPKPTKKGGRKK